jgi:hypothetical protein
VKLNQAQRRPDEAFQRAGMTASEPKLRHALNRIMRVWSLIKLVPEQRLSVPRSLVEAELLEHSHLANNELVVVGLKYLHRVDGCVRPRRAEIAKNDNAAKSAFSDEDILERLAKLF